MLSHGWCMTLAALGAGCLVSTAAPATTIGFGGLAAGTPFTGYTQDGFTVAPVSGVWSVNGYGAPGPSIVFVDNQGVGGQASSVAVTRAGEVFTFGAIDLYSSVTPIPYTLLGTLGGRTVFSASGTVPNTFGNFATVPSNDAIAAIDRLEVTLTTVRLVPAVGSNPYGIDNIVVSATAAPVPEVPSLWLLASALAVLGGARPGRALRRSLG